jgi:hypothetical protein
VTALAQHNARLTKIAGGGVSEDYDQPEGSQPAKWTGDIEATVVERAVEEISTGRADQVNLTHLLVSNALTVVPDDELTYFYRGTAVTRTVREVQRHDVLGLIRVYFVDV